MAKTPTPTRGGKNTPPAPQRPAQRGGAAQAGQQRSGVPAVQRNAGKAGVPAPADLMQDMAADAGKGIATGVDDLAIPFLYIAQANSPQLKKQDGKFIQGLAQGDIFNNVTGEFWPTSNGEGGPTVISCFYQRRFLRWAPRDSGGGLVSIHTPEEAVELLKQTTKDDRNRDVFDGGDLLVNTAEHYLLILKDDGVIDRAVVAMSSTQLKKSKQWNTMMMGATAEDGNGKRFTPPAFAQLYLLNTVPESNNDGDWHGWKINRADPFIVSEPEVYHAAKSFHESIKRGAAKVEYRADPTGDAAPAGDGSF